MRLSSRLCALTAAAGIALTGLVAPDSAGDRSTETIYRAYSIGSA